MKRHPFHIHIPKEPVDLWAKLKRLAKLNHRTIKAEALIAIENHLIENKQLSDEEIQLLQEFVEEED